VKAQQATAAVSNNKPETQAKTQSEPQRTLSYNERKEYNKLEKEIQKLGLQIKELEDQLASSKEGYSVLAELTNKANALREQMNQKEERWLELAEIAGDV
jgi:ATP-binding cassette subfamily F protein uup